MEKYLPFTAKFLYEIETGKKGFSADTLSRISVALSVSCDYIMFGEETGHHTSERIMCVGNNEACPSLSDSKYIANLI